jgi:cell division protein FtsB
MAKKVIYSIARVGEAIGRRGLFRGANRAKVLLIAVVVTIVFLPSFVKYQLLSHKNRQLEARIRTLSDDNRRLEEEKRRLETDITYVEKRAREEMGVARKGEIVIKDIGKRK